MGVVQTWRAELARRGYQADAAQLAAIERLQRMHDELVVFKAKRSTRLKRLINRPAVPRGVWMYGGVGRGKSFLMDCFYEAVPVVRKTRLHFHEFMRGVHRELEELKGTADPLDAVAERVARRYRLICFDEFHVSDIADAMILERLMRGLFAHGVTFVMTSNYHPDALYPEGLHRDRVLPAIALIREHVDVVNVDAGVDYRRRSMAQVQAYHWPDDAAARAALEQAFVAVAEAHDENPQMLIENRELRALRRAGGAVWFDFDTLCGGPRSQNDYLELASLFHTVILSGVPKMGANMASQARRFVWLVDVLYDRRVKLIVSAACPPEQLYTEGSFANEFHRTVSRLVEMQSREYLEAPRREEGAALGAAG
ncbi:cell division protein ZapE [Burkholderiaceae bacterium FT117]|uniref:cell division protein ZapE n=1 Tax=Zeimonas sediminis TaxID=2944268 RepID=UPI002342E585|nr:cell division protein ZapE [Zeimonas sediminis]MCM5569110.1 cell division protein ZapE [Zeimonas sediminis]